METFKIKLQRKPKYRIIQVDNYRRKGVITPNVGNKVVVNGKLGTISDKFISSSGDYTYAVMFNNGGYCFADSNLRQVGSFSVKGGYILYLVP